MPSISPGNDHKESSASIIMGDPLLRRLSRTKVSPVVVALTFVLLLAFLRGLGAWQVSLLRTSGATAGFFNDPATYTNLVAYAITVAYYVWMPRGINEVFTKLRDNKVITEPELAADAGERRWDSYTSFAADMEDWFDRRWWPALILAIVVVTEVTLVLPQYLAMGQSAWWTANTLNLIGSILWSSIAVYCLGSILVYSAFTILWLNRLFGEFPVRIRPLYPDHAGGLAPLGEFTLRQSYLAAMVGIMLVITPVTRNYVVNGTLEFRWTTEILVGLSVYLIAAPIVFFATLSVAHASMRRSKDQFLLEIARRFESEYVNIQDALHPDHEDISDLEQVAESRRAAQTSHDQELPCSPSSDLSSLDQSLETLEQLQDLYDMTSRFPVWPFNMANLRRFSTSYLSPVLLAIIVNLVSELM